MKTNSAEVCRVLQDALGEEDRPDTDKAVLGEALKGQVLEAPRLAEVLSDNEAA